jgi:hypothetical protein
MRKVSSAADLTPSGKSWALVVIVAGLLTFFAPLITTDSPVLGKTRWSVFDVTRHLAAGDLPPASRRPNDPVDLYVGLGLSLWPVYLLWLYAAAAVLLSLKSLSRKLTIVGCAGIFIAAETWQWHKNTFEEILNGGWSYHNLQLVRHVGFGQLIFTIAVVMGVLVCIARDTNSNADISPEKVKRGESSDERNWSF